MTAYFVSLDLFDPNAPEQTETGQTYGGAAQLFVIEASEITDALQQLTAKIAEKGQSVLQIRAAAPVEVFETDDFPFAVDLAAMAEDATSANKITATPAYSFASYGRKGTGLYVCTIELFDPVRAESDGSYLGEYRMVAMKTDSCQAALEALLVDLSSGGTVLRSIDGLLDADFYDPDTPFNGRSLDQMAEMEIPNGSVIWKEGAIYFGDGDE